MGLLDGILGQIGSNVDVKGLAEKVGLSPDQVEMAVSALGKAHSDPSDTVDVAASKTGLSSDILKQIVEQIGGEGSLAKYASMLDQDGDGNPLNDIAGMAGKLFGKN